MKEIIKADEIKWFKTKITSRRETRNKRAKERGGEGRGENQKPHNTLLLFRRSVGSSSLRPHDCSRPGFAVHHQPSKLAQTHVH